MAKKLIVGLGNIGEQYEKTKHNVGFMVIDTIINKLNLKLDNFSFNGTYTKTIINGEEVFFAKPSTMMNLSGTFVKELSLFFKINIQNILIIYDDMDIDFGQLKLKKSGSSGGQKGMENIINHFASEKIKRIKIGISRPARTLSEKSVINYVLSNFKNNELEKLNLVISKASQAALEFLNTDFEILMSKYNQKV